MRNRIVMIRHGDDPPDDRTHTYFTTHGFEVDVKRPFAGDALAEPDESVAGTVLHGGPFDVDSFAENPFLRDEYRWIDACMSRGVPMLGICQGAQQIALHLGGEVGPRPGEPHEFGYYRVDPMPEAHDFLDRPRWFTQAHFHQFSIPSGAERLAFSETFENQAFRYGPHTYGLQFHPEVTIEGFRRWQAADWAMFDKPGAQQKAEQDRLMAEHDRGQADWFYSFLEKLFGVPGNA